MERGLSILWIDAICGSVQNSMTPPEKNVVPRVGKPTLYVAHVYSWLRAGLLANFENRLLGRTVGLDWIGVALALVGIGIALRPLADQFNFLKPYAVPGGVALILATMSRPKLCAGWAAACGPAVDGLYLAQDLTS